MCDIYGEYIPLKQAYKLLLYNSEAELKRAVSRKNVPLQTYAVKCKKEQSISSKELVDFLISQHAEARKRNLVDKGGISM